MRTRHPAAGCSRAGTTAHRFDHDDEVRPRTSGPESKPACMDAMTQATERALWATTGMARDPDLASARNRALVVPGPAVTISGRPRARSSRPVHRSPPDRMRSAGTGRGVIAGTSVTPADSGSRAAPDRPGARRRHRDFMRARHHVGDWPGRRSS